MRFNEKLSRMMRSLALSNLELAGRLGHGVAHTTVARWLAGSRPRGRTARLLAQYFGVPVETLLDDSTDLPPPYAVTEATPIGEILALSERTGESLISLYTSDAAEKARAYAESRLRHAKELREMAAEIESMAREDLRELDRRPPPAENGAGGNPLGSEILPKSRARQRRQARPPA